MSVIYMSVSFIRIRYPKWSITFTRDFSARSTLFGKLLQTVTLAVGRTPLIKLRVTTELKLWFKKVLQLQNGIYELRKTQKYAWWEMIRQFVMTSECDNEWVKNVTICILESKIKSPSIKSPSSEPISRELHSFPFPGTWSSHYY